MKIVIDAYNGTTSFYLAEPNDPLALTIAKIFPGHAAAAVATCRPDLRQHVRYPEDIFKIQSAVYRDVPHDQSAGLLQQGRPVAGAGARRASANAMPMQPYYTIMRLPGEKQTEFIQMLPFTPRLKDNLAAWMVARSDGEHYGRLLVFQFPKQKIVFGPQQIVGRINQDQVISPQITLWNQQGSRGDLGHAARDSRSTNRCSTCGRCTCGRPRAASPS